MYSAQNTRIVPDVAASGVVRRYMHARFPCISLVVGPARRSARCFGENWSGSNGVWVALHQLYPKHTPVYSAQSTRIIPNIATSGVVRQYTHARFPCISLVVGPAQRPAQCFGENRSGSDGVWVALHHTHPQLSKYTIFIFSKTTCL